MPRRRRWLRLKYFTWIVAGLLVLLLLVVPNILVYMVDQSGHVPGGLERYMLWTESMIFWLMMCFAVLWVFFLGATFASFLNVVADRVPQGMSILGSSHCPFCNVQLTFKDNIPVWGWLKNGGRCFNCRLPISPRYLFVELALGTVFLALAALTLTNGGAMLPIREPDDVFAVVRKVFEPEFDLVLILAVQLVGLLGVFTLSLVELERHKIPFSIWAVTVTFVTLIILIWPQSLLMSWLYPLANVELPMSRSLAVVSAGIGMSAGFFVGWILDVFLQERSWGTGNESAEVGGLRVVWGLSIVGLFAGWQSVVVIGVFYVFVRAVGLRFVSDNKNSYLSNLFWSPNAALLVATLIHLASWGWMNTLS